MNQVFETDFASSSGPDASPVQLLLNTDLNTDCGDAGALALLHALADLGEVEILGIGVCVSNPDVPGAVRAINAYYGRGDLPLSRYTGLPLIEPEGHAFVTAAARFGPPTPSEPLPDTIAMYRRLLAAELDGAVTFVAIGFMYTLERLLTSGPDAHSPLLGRDLVRAKVGRLVVMGGAYPYSDIRLLEPLKGAEYNFYNAPASADRVCREWPTPVTFAGFEVGEAVLAGRLLTTRAPADKPVRVTYEVFDHPQGRSAWDKIAVLRAVRGPRHGEVQLFEEVSGTNTVGPATGSNKFLPGSGTHAYLAKCQPDEYYAALFDELQARPPKARRSSTWPLRPEFC